MRPHSTDADREGGFDGLRGRMEADRWELACLRAKLSETYDLIDIGKSAYAESLALLRAVDAGARR